MRIHISRTIQCCCQSTAFISRFYATVGCPITAGLSTETHTIWNSTIGLTSHYHYIITSSHSQYWMLHLFVFTACTLKRPLAYYWFSLVTKTHNTPPNWLCSFKPSLMTLICSLNCFHFWTLLFLSSICMHIFRAQHISTLELVDIMSRRLGGLPRGMLTVRLKENHCDLADSGDTWEVKWCLLKQRSNTNGICARLSQPFDIQSSSGFHWIATISTVLNRSSFCIVVLLP